MIAAHLEAASIWEVQLDIYLNVAPRYSKLSELDARLCFLAL
jgi:hypothetical protein